MSRTFRSTASAGAAVLLRRGGGHDRHASYAWRKMTPMNVILVLLIPVVLGAFPLAMERLEARVVD